MGPGSVKSVPSYTTAPLTKFTGSKPAWQSARLSQLGPIAPLSILLNSFLPYFINAPKPNPITRFLSIPPQSGTYGPPTITGWPVGIGKEYDVGANSVGTTFQNFLLPGCSDNGIP